MIGRAGYDLTRLGLRLVFQLWPLWLCWFAWSLAAGLYDTALLAARDVPGPLARPLFGLLLLLRPAGHLLGPIALLVTRPLPPSPFTAAERALLRYEFMVRFGQAPSLTDGIWLRAWRGGPQAGQPKIPPAVASLLARGLVELGPDRIGFRARFTAAGVAALRLLAQDRRALDPRQYAHILDELEADPATADPGTMA